MRSAPLAALFAAFAAAVLGGCGGAARGDLELLWTFAGGRTCAQVGVATIQVAIDGELLTPDLFSCAADGGGVTAGAHLGRFLLGSYRLTVLGLDSSGAVRFRAVQTIQVQRGPNVLTIDLQQTSATVTLYWTFDGKSCAAAGVTVVHASVDGLLLASAGGNVDLPCSQNGVDGVQVGPLSAGAHSFDLVGLRGTAAAFVLRGFRTTAVEGRDTAFFPNLPPAQPATATALVRWSFAGGMTCAEAKVDGVNIRVDPPSSDGFGGADAGLFPCSSGGVFGADLSNVAPGSHTFAISGVRGTSLVYQSARSDPVPFLIGLSTIVQIDAAAVSPKRGGATLAWSFPSGVANCASTAQPAVTVSYVLTPPSGASLAPASSICGGPTGNTGVVFCNPGSAGCPLSEPGLVPGLWRLDASAPVAGKSYAAHVLFGVPNAETGSYLIALAPQ